MQTGRRSRRKETGNIPLEVDIDQRGDLLHFPMPPHKYGLIPAEDFRARGKEP